MTHAINQTLDLIVAELTGNTDAGANVSIDDGSVEEKEKLPYIEIIYVSDTESESSVLGKHSRDVEVNFRIVDRKYSGAKVSVMAIRSQVETLFNGCDVTMGSQSFPHVMNECEWSTESEGENKSIELNMNYQFLVRWAFGVPDTLA